MAKKDLQDAITRGADLFFSANDAQQTETPEDQKTQQVYEVQEPRKPYKAQEVTIEQLESMVQDMKEQITLTEARRTQGRKGMKMPRMNMGFTPSNYDYLRVMSGVSGMTITLFMNKIIEQHKAANESKYQRAKELMRDE